MLGGTDRPRSFVSPYSHLIALIFTHICVEEYGTLKSNKKKTRLPAGFGLKVK